MKFSALLFSLCLLFQGTASATEVISKRAATAECRDGTKSYSSSRRGTCSRHGGVKKWH